MTIKSSGPLSLLGDIRGEFGGNLPVSLKQYYRGGGRVPDSSVNQRIPTSGPIRFSDFYGARRSFAITYAIGDTFNFDLYNDLRDYRGWDTVTPLDMTIIVGGTVGSASPEAPAFVVPPYFPNGSIIRLRVDGAIIGAGGRGGNAGAGRSGSLSNGGAGQDGGTGLYVRFPIILMGGGMIAGGGGGGGGGGGATCPECYDDPGAPGGGGAGVNGGAPGTASGKFQNANPGSREFGGSGGVVQPNNSKEWNQGGNGGAGGNLGQDGQPGANGGAVGGAGGRGGFAIDGEGAYVTYG